MSSIKTTTNKFPDIIISFMLDYIMNEDSMDIENDKWTIFLDSFKSKGLKPALIKYYIATNAVDKSKYKMIKNVFSNKKTEKKSTIAILNSRNKEKEKPTKKSILKKVIKKIITTIKNEKKKCYGMPLHESKIDNIIDSVLKEYYNDDIVDEIKEIING